MTCYLYYNLSPYSWRDVFILKHSSVLFHFMRYIYIYNNMRYKLVHEVCKLYHSNGVYRLAAIAGILSWHSVLQPSHCNSFEDRAPVDFIYGCPIFKRVAVTWLPRDDPTIVVPVMVPRVTCPIDLSVRTRRPWWCHEAPPGYGTLSYWPGDQGFGTWRWRLLRASRIISSSYPWSTWYK